MDGYSPSLALADIEECAHLSERAKIGLLHREAVRRGLDAYIDPATGYDVFSAHHLKTRDCCGSSCRHCPWGHRNVPGKKKQAMTTAAAADAAPAQPLPEQQEQPSPPLPPPPPPAATTSSLESGATPPPRSRLYTRKGDSGWGTLYNEQSLLKSDGIYEAIGTVDELNSVVGLACSLIAPPSGQIPATRELSGQLETVQAWLLDVGSALCTPRNSTENVRKLQRTRGVSHEAVVTLEGWIDAADSQLHKLLNFILPGGSQGAAALHVARTVCRRAERRVWPLLLSGHQEEVIGVFLNRLSDFLFVAARLDAHSVGASEQRYKIEWRVDRWQRQIVPAD